MGVAQGFSMVNVKYQCQSARVEGADSTRQLKTDIAERHREGMDVTKGLQSDQAKLQACIRELQLACNGLSSEFKDLKQQMVDMEHREKEDAVTRHEASVGLNEDMSKMTVEVNQVLDAQRTEFATKIEAVAERNAVAHESVDNMKGTVDDLPRQIYNVTAQLQVRVQTIAEAVRILVDGPDVEEEEEVEEGEYIEERWTKGGIQFLKKQGKGQKMYKEMGSPETFTIVSKEQKKIVKEQAGLLWEDALEKEYVQQIPGWEWSEKGVQFLKSKGEELYKNANTPSVGQPIATEDQDFLKEELDLEWEAAIKEGYVKITEKKEEVEPEGSAKGSEAGSEAGSGHAG